MDLWNKNEDNINEFTIFEVLTKCRWEFQTNRMLCHDVRWVFLNVWKESKKVSIIQDGLKDQDLADKILQVFRIISIFSPKNNFIATCFKFRQTDAEGGKSLHKAGKSPYTTQCENPADLYTSVTSYLFCALHSY